jgi:hypothetical protein
VCLADKKKYVIKQIDIASMSGTERKEALQEVLATHTRTKERGAQGEWGIAVRRVCE